MFHVKHSEKKVCGEVVSTLYYPYIGVMDKQQVAEIARLAEQLREALKALAGPSGKMTSWWFGKPQDWPEGLPWSDEQIAAATNALGSLTLDEEDWE